MTKVILNKKTVLNLLKKKLNSSELEEKITRMGTPLEELNNDDMVVEIFPNRPDLLSEHGFSRALNTFLGYNPGLKYYKVNHSNETVIIDRSVKNVRPFTACAIVKNLKLCNESIKEIIQLQEKLHLTYCRNRRKIAIGVYPFEKIKTPIRFLAVESNKVRFKPLGYNEVMSAEEILSKHETGKSYANLLDDLDRYPLFVDANNQILSMPPIINSQDVGEVTEKTKDVFIECSGFDFKALNKCLNIIVTSLSEIGGDIYSMKLKYGNKIFVTPDLSPTKMDINIKNVNRRLGLNLDEKEIKRYLERMGHKYINKKVLIPCYRTDVMHEVDLIEDIAIAYGYENFGIELPKISTIGEEDKFEYFKGRIAEFLVGLNLLETSSYVISNKQDQNDKMLVNNDLIVLENSLNQEYNVLRASLLSSLLKILRDNKHNEYPQRLFEIGKVFSKDRSETNVKESNNLGIVISHSGANFTEIKQILDALMNTLNLRYSINEIENETFIKGRVGGVFIDNKKIAHFGELNPAVLTRWNLELPTVALELNLNYLSELIDY